MNLINRGYIKWQRLGYINFILSTTLLILISLIPFAALLEFLNISEDEIGGVDSDNYTPIGLFLMAVVFAPIMETLFLQTLPIKILQGFLRRKYEILIVLCSSLLFALMHFGYSSWYCLLIFPTGIILAKTYIIFQKRKESSFWITTSIHSLRNLIGVIFILLET